MPRLQRALAAHPRPVILTPDHYPVLGGVETHARQLARGLRRHGLHVWILTKRIDAGTPARDTLDGIPVLRVGPSGPRAPAGKWRMLPAVARTLLRERGWYDVIVCPDYRGVGLAALLAGRLLRRPVIFQAATPGALSCANWDPALQRVRLNPRAWPARAIKAVARGWYGDADAYACISREIEQEARLTARRRERVYYLPHGVDVAAFRPPSPDERLMARQQLGIAPRQKALAFVGRLSREKGVLDLIEAWQRIDRADAVLLLVGPDMPGHDLDVGPQAREAARSSSNGRLRLLGPADDVRPALWAADVFVQPSHYEAFGISVIEAMATTLPIVATRVGGMAEFLVDFENARLCAPHDPQGLAAALISVLDDQTLSGRLATNARLTVEKMFDEEVVIRRWLDLLDEVTGRATAAALARAATTIGHSGSG